ncbi:unnamed protein product [Sphagnum tenellum]
MILCTPALVNASFKHYTLCGRKQECIFHTFVSLGGWWFLLGVDKDQMRSISKAYQKTDHDMCRGCHHASTSVGIPKV